MKKHIVGKLIACLAVSAWLAGCPGCLQTTLFPVAQDATVAAMIAGVEQAAVETQLRGLTGESPIVVGGESITLTTRNATDEEATRLVTQYAFEFMQAQGLPVHYENWTDDAEGIAGRNVVAEISGTTRPDEIVLVSAHLDNMPEEGRAPGADDNASGSTGVLLTAAQLAGHGFERTIRFVLFTGEEYGPSGSQAYAAACRARDDNILGMLNLDCIGWDDNDDGIMFLQTSNILRPGIHKNDLDLANAFIAVIDVYGIDALTPEREGNWSMGADTQSFWDEGYPAVLAIEDEKNESNPNWHETTDTLATLNLPYCTNFIKVAVGAAAHMAAPMP